MDFVGTWNIYKMSMWDENYFNMEVQAFITINENLCGEFQFGLVTGGFSGELIKNSKGGKFQFMWSGCDECDPAFGSGWIRIVKNNQIEGEFIFHLAERSKFWALKVQ